MVATAPPPTTDAQPMVPKIMMYNPASGSKKG